MFIKNIHFFSSFNAKMGSCHLLENLLQKHFLYVGLNVIAIVWQWEISECNGIVVVKREKIRNNFVEVHAYCTVSATYCFNAILL